MHRDDPDYWYTPKAGFCKYAADTRAKHIHLLFVVDPEKAIQYWKDYGFSDLYNWARKGFPGPCFITKADIWILSPDEEGG
jgi:hypothetical protein